MPNGMGDGGSLRQEEPAISIVNTLSIVIVIGFLGMIPLWMWFPPMTSEGVLAIINMLIGSLVTAFATVVAYHFGSSRTTKDLGAANREAMTTMASTAATVANTAAQVAAVAAPIVPVPPVVPPAGATDQVHVEGDVAVTGAPEGATGKPPGTTESKGGA